MTTSEFAAMAGCPSPKPRPFCRQMISQQDHGTVSSDAEGALSGLRLLALLFDGHKQVALENLELRHQLSVSKRDVGDQTYINGTDFFECGQVNATLLRLSSSLQINGTRPASVALRATLRQRSAIETQEATAMKVSITYCVP